MRQVSHCFMGHETKRALRECRDVVIRHIQMEALQVRHVAGDLDR